MALTIANAGALLGAPVEGNPMSVSIQAIRSFWFDGVIVEPGQIIAAPVVEASELIHSNKAQLAPAEVSEPEPQEPTEDPRAKAKAKAAS